MQKPSDGLYIVFISVHGLIRGKDLELGRDADTGGQTKYVVELACALGEHPDVRRVDVITRQVFDKKVHPDYSQPSESLTDYTRIIRLPCGPKRYLRKEVLWPYLDSFIDNILQHTRRVGVIPDLVHAHYADAGYVGSGLVQLLGVPLIFTGHSLGRVKRQRLLDNGRKIQFIESQYNMTARIEAEETALDNANMVITSTHQEVEQQYCLYDKYQPRRMVVIPPGVDLKRFYPQQFSQGLIDKKPSAIQNELERFLREPEKPIILAISRPDERKNIGGLLKAYGESKPLQKLANLVIIVGNRDDIVSMDHGARGVLNNMLRLIDKYDLYGLVAYPKHHDPDDIAQLYRIAAHSRGVFINPALTEPFGLTLIEAAASGLPVIATQDGGPQDIIASCTNGLLIDPLDSAAMAATLFELLSDKEQWLIYSTNGEKGAHRHFTWNTHVHHYLKTAEQVIKNSRRVTDVTSKNRNRLVIIDRMVVCDIDNTLIGANESLYQLMDMIENSDGKVGFAVATGRRIDSAMSVLNEYDLPTPDLFISSVGSEIHYGHRMVEDSLWYKHINYRWHPEALQDTLLRLPGLKLQPSIDQRRFKVSFLIDPSKAPSIKEIRSHLRKRDLHAKLIYSHQSFLDLLPERASKGMAVRYIAARWGLTPGRILVAGDSGNDAEMLKGNTLGVVVGNYSKELANLRGQHNIYFADRYYAAGVIEGIRHYNFLDDILLKKNSGTAKNNQETCMSPLLGQTGIL
ncbi:MAG: HAD-IIB family hydrolase [Thiohalomonadales bacterium]